ncbi:Zinc finger CCCH domain-containing protein 53 [Acorus calamus]|uniref:Zinc finger CCCH domain-containing protein 53 n=1 Tax=Acorus calamus TaxID=4465 RepID=A0AAV9EWM8_ACOCL|nr:Zinc finger CCCH domain-containing protein 53 [Acorus calamus]
MDSYEATRIVFSRIQGLDPENAPKIMGLLLIQDHGEKEMIRLAFGPEALIQSVVLKAKKELGLHSSSPSTSPSTPSSPSPFLSSNSSSSAGVVSRHGLSMSRLLPPLTVPSPGPWSPSPGTTTAFSRNGEDLQNPDELLSPNTSYTAVNSMVSSPFYGEDLHIDELQLPDHLSFLNVTSGVTCPPIHSLSINKGGDLYYPDECRSPGDSCSSMDSLSFPYWGVNGHPHHRRSCSAVDFCPDSAALGSGIGWKPCLYFARGFCKNGSSCRFVHGLSDPVAEMGGGGGKMDGVMVEQCQQELLRSKSLRLSSSPSQQFMASAASFPYGSPVASSKCMNFLMQQQHHHQQQQQQQNDVQRSAMAAAAALMLGDEPQNRFMRSRMERGDFLGNGIVNPGSRQIYLTFPADSTFREEDVSNYFSLYGPVQDVRIPYQQKRMFGFVTFVYPETVKLILAKGNPHFVCDARVLVKPYKEKGKVPDKKQQQQQHTQERGGGDFSACSTPTGLDSRENPYDLQLGGGGRPLYNNGVMAEEATLRRKLEEQSDLQQAIEIQGRRLLNLQLLEMNQHHHGPPYHHLRPPHTSPPTGFSCPSPGPVRVNNPFDSGISGSPPEKSTSPGATAGIVNPTAADDHHQNKQQQQQRMVERGGGGLEDEPDARESACDGSPPKNDFGFRESVTISEHNLPESPFASPTKSYFTASSTGDVERAASPAATTLGVINSNDGLLASSLLPPAASPVDMPSLKACFFQIPRFSSGHGAVGM